MKIFIEGSALYSQRSGVGQYTKRLSEAMAKASGGDTFTIFGFKLFIRPLPTNLVRPMRNIHYRFIRFFPGRIYTELIKRVSLRLPLDPLLMSRPDIAFYPNFALWPFWNKRTKTVVTIHDLSYTHYPQYVSPPNRRHLERSVPYAVRKVDHIFTISEFTKQQIIDLYQADPAKISLVPPGIDPSDYYKRSAKEISAIRRKYKLPKDYLFFVSTLEPRKNVTGILEAYDQLEASLQMKYALVLAGGKGWLDESITTMLVRLQKKGLNIITTGYVPDEDLPALYSGAALFVFPSLYEGFGIPVLEAMACEVPVVTANNTSLPEVADDAAIMVQAEDTDAISAAVQRVLTDQKLADSLRAKGLKQVQKFTWEKSAEKALKIFEELAKS